MSKITYENKVGIEPKTVAINQVQDVDMNLIKSVVNDNDTTSVSSAYPILFDKTSAGRRYGSWSAPLSGVIVLSSIGIQEGGCAMVIWQGPSNPTFTGGTVNYVNGTIVKEDRYSIYIHFVNGFFNVNIFDANKTETPPSPIIAPNTLANGTVTQTTIPLTWINGQTYTEVRAYNNGFVLQTFGGNVESGTLTGLPTNTNYSNLTVRGFIDTIESTDSNSLNVSTLPSAGEPTASVPTITVTEGRTATAPTITVT